MRCVSRNPRRSRHECSEMHATRPPGPASSMPDVDVRRGRRSRRAADRHRTRLLLRPAATAPVGPHADAVRADRSARQEAAGRRAHDHVAAAEVDDDHVRHAAPQRDRAQPALRRAPARPGPRTRSHARLISPRAAETDASVRPPMLAATSPCSLDREPEAAARLAAPRRLAGQDERRARVGGPQVGREAEPRRAARAAAPRGRRPTRRNRRGRTGAPPRAPHAASRHDDAPCAASPSSATATSACSSAGRPCR